MQKEFVCIACPVGCRLTVKEENGEYRVSGNACRRGEVYGKQEFSAPERVVTSTVRVAGQSYRMCPIKTDKPVPKEQVAVVLARIYDLEAALPVRVGDVLLEDVCQTGANIVATANMK